MSELGGVPEELRERIVGSAEGNPLFLEEMLALVRDSGGERVEVHLPNNAGPPGRAARPARSG